MSTRERILFLYLPTGGGHISAARALAAEIAARYSPGEVEVFILDGMNPGSRLQRNIVEGGYQFTTLKVPIIWPLLFQTSTMPAMMAVHTWAMTMYSAPHLRRFIREHGITRIVNLHFLLIRPLHRALTQLKRRTIPSLTVVTDPFTAHPLWFYYQFMPVVVFSRRAQKDGSLYLKLYRKREILFRASKPTVTLLPPILNPRYNRVLPREETARLKERYGFSPGKRLVILTGGGEGLPRGDVYLSALAESGLDIDLAIVCGKNEALREHALRAAAGAAAAGHAIAVYGFIDFMYDLVNMADIVVTKAGPATIFECLLLEKPMIITQRLYGQEQGNVDFVVKNRLGWFIPDPVRMTAVIRDLLDRPQAFDDIRTRIRERGIRNGTAEIADFIMALTTDTVSRIDNLKAMVRAGASRAREGKSHGGSSRAAGSPRGGGPRDRTGEPRTGGPRDTGSEPK